MSASRSYASKYNELGYRTVPLYPKSKVPAAGLAHRDATRDPQQTRQQFDKSPQAAGVAIVLDEQVVVLDIDRRHDGHNTIAGLENEHGPLPACPTVKTGNGEHRYFRVSQPLKATELGSGVELKASGKGLVAPPSVHPSGTPYVWQQELRKPSDLPDLPQNWLKLATPKQAKIRKSTRFDAVKAFACELMNRRPTEDEFAMGVRELNNTKCDPPLPDSKVNGIIKWVWENHDPLAAQSEIELWWMQFDTDEFLEAKVQSLRDYQRGWLLNLAAHAWRGKGYLPTSDPEKLARLANADDRERFRTEVQEVLFDYEPITLADGSEGLRHMKLQPLWEEKQVVSKTKGVAARIKAEKERRAKQEAEKFGTEDVKLPQYGQ
jgi:Bifunctional DNA primase/polymerase, N-terminal